MTRAQFSLNLIYILELFKDKMMEEFSSIIFMVLLNKRYGCFRFTGLEPYTEYNVTFYIQDSKSNRSYASMKYINTMTGEGGRLLHVIHKLWLYNYIYNTIRHSDFLKRFYIYVIINYKFNRSRI